MPKKIDEQLKARAVRLVTEHQQEYPLLTAACEAVARQVGVGQESVRRASAVSKPPRGGNAGGRLAPLPVLDLAFRHRFDPSGAPSMILRHVALERRQVRVRPLSRCCSSVAARSVKPVST